MSNLEKRALRAGSFVHNNGKVLRTVNILRLKYNKLTGVQSVLADDGIAEDEFLDSVNFLAEEGYIHLRRISTKESAESKGKKKRMSAAERQAMIQQLTLEMQNAAKMLEFEHAAYLRDKIKKLKEQK